MPDADILRTRLLGIAYEHGLLDGISDEVPDIILAGLEYHLRDFLQQIFDRVRPTKHKKMSDVPFVSLIPPQQSAQLAGPQQLAIASGANEPNGVVSQVKDDKEAEPVTNGVTGKKRKRQRFEDENIITAEDMALVLELVPHSVVEPSGPMYRLFDVMLQDEIDDERPEPITE